MKDRPDSEGWWWCLHNEPLYRNGECPWIPVLVQNNQGDLRAFGFRGADCWVKDINIGDLMGSKWVKAILPKAT